MKKGKFWMGIPVMVLVFGMMIAGCAIAPPSVNPWKQNLWLANRLNTTPPSSDALSAGGITQAQFDQIIAAAGGGFLGWEVRQTWFGIQNGIQNIDDQGEIPETLMMVWEGRSVANFVAVEYLLSGFDRPVGVRIDWQSISVPPTHFASGDGFDLEFYSRSASYGPQFYYAWYIHAGTMVANLSWN